MSQRLISLWLIWYKYETNREEIRNSKHEIRDKLEIQNHKFETIKSIKTFKLVEAIDVEL
jgi:hypothetical protein